MKKLLLAALVTSILVPVAAFGDDSATPAIGSDSKGTIVELPDVKWGSIELSAFPGRANVGYFKDSNGESGMRLDVSGNRNFYIFGSEDREHGGSNYNHGDQQEWGVFKVDAGIKLLADFDKKEVKRFQLETPRFGFLGIQHRAYSPEETYWSDREKRDAKPYVTASFEGVSLGYQTNQAEGANTKLSGADLRFVSGEVHGATDVEGVNVDYFLTAGGIWRTGQVNGSQERGMAGIQGSAGLGVSLGVVGNLRAEAGYLGILAYGDDKPGQEDVKEENKKTYAHTTFQQLSLTARLDKPAGLPISAAATYSYDQAVSGGPETETKGYSQTVFSVGGAY